MRDLIERLERRLKAEIVVPGDLRIDLQDAVAALRSLEPQPIETAPRDGTDILLFFPDADIAWMPGHAFPEDEDEDWYPQDVSALHGAPYDVEPTHWLPLPTVQP